VRGGGLLQRAGPDTGTNAGNPAVDDDLVQVTGPQQDRAVGAAGGAVAVGLRGDAHTGGRRVPHQRGHIGGIGRLHHRRHRLLDRQVPGPAHAVEALVARKPRAATHH
jgi:hypothetical protein